VPYSWPSKKRAILRNIGKISKSLQVTHTSRREGWRERERVREWVSESEREKPADHFADSNLNQKLSLYLQLQD
jgi:hypothetical protein